MTDIKKAFGTTTAMTITLTSLANGAGRQSTEVDNTTNLYLDALVRIKANGSSASNTGNLEVYAIGNIGDDVRVDGAGATDALLTVRNAKLIGVITMNGTTSVTGAMFSVASAFNNTLPAKWSIAVYNNSGAALSATGGDFDVDYRGVYETNA